ncbi:hypothetical protein [Chryseobacterium culicis]|uniref:hypothetical protein n=1 Tax=Chryseobacterium culicis TaxID=680127 RepID=UPI002583F9B5|nr:hypothetical protein [Chryseobacterium culicis]
MKFKILFLFLMVPLFYLKAQNKVNDYLNVPGPIDINRKEYNLVWSSHPNENYFKQEYLHPKEDIHRYNSMVLIDFVKGNFTLKDAIDQKVTELEEKKKTNPVVNYKILEKGDEYILDFIISQNSEDGSEILIAERNVYRYKLINDVKNKGILLFAVSERGYKQNMDTFFTNLKNNSSQLIEIVGNYKLPEIKIK